MKRFLMTAFCFWLGLHLHAQVVFTLSSSPGVGPTPEGVVAADVNGDGFPDVMTPNQGNDTVTVLTNDGHGALLLSSTAATAGGQLGLPAIADVNGDGKMDFLAAGYYNNTISVLTNNGNGVLVLAASPASGTYPMGVAAADLFGNGKIELLSVNSAVEDSTISVLVDNGTGGYATVGKYAVASNPHTVFVADVNGDGKPDLIAASYGASAVTVLTNTGIGGFASAGIYSVSGSPVHAIAVDVNGDGKLDIISANYTGNSITVLTNNGTGGFTNSATYSVGSNPNFIASGDLNGDGSMDLAVVNYGSSTLTVLTNNGNGGFSTAGTFGVGTNPRAVVAVDMNGDGKLDLCTANEGSSTVTILTNGTVFPSIAPRITTQPAGQTNVVGSSIAFTVAATGSFPLAYQWRFSGTNINGATNSSLNLANVALNQAGAYDVVITNYYGSVTSSPAILDVRFILVKVNGQIATGTATALAPATITLLGGYAGGYLFYTLDGSAPSVGSTLYSGPFALTNSATIRVLGLSSDFSQQSEGVPVVVQITPTYTLQTSIVGNGTLSTNPMAAFYLSNSVVTLTATPATNWIFAYWAGDTNSTQNPLSITMNGSRNIQAVFIQTPGLVLFSLASSPTVGNTCQYLTAADINGDGKPDLATVSAAGSSFYVLTNNGNGSGGFALAASPTSTSTANTVLAVDVNGDGKLDLVSADYYGETFTIMTNNGAGGFVLASSPATGTYPLGIAAADLNGDGKLELLAGNSGSPDNSVWVLTNNGVGGFSTSGKYPVGVNPWSVYTADVNGDGKLDIVTANYGANTVSVLTNDWHGGFATAGTYAVGTNPREAIAVDINGDGKPDIITANYGANTISVLTNNGSGGFVLSATYPTGSNPDFLAAGDVNGDGVVDLTVANYSSDTLLVLTNNGGGGFAVAATFPVTGNPRAVVAVDVNGDGKLDLCAASDNSSVITVLTNGTAFPQIPPRILLQPVGQTNTVGSTINFSVGAYANSPLFYQWRYLGTNISGATNSSLSLTNVALNQSGNYDVVVTNYLGSVTSSPAMLDVLFVLVKVNGQTTIGSTTAVAPATITLLGGYTGGYLFYTLDGSAPSTSSTLYSAPFSLTNSATIRVLSLSSDFSQQSEGVPVAVQIVPTYSLQTSILGNGTLSTNPPTGPYASNSVVTLTATPAAHWSFVSWAGDASGSQTQLSVTMNGPRNIQAVFVQNAYPLTLTTPGGGSVTANGAFIPASTYYPTGTVVTVAATPSSGWLFLGWQGSISSTNNPVLVTMNQTNNIQAIFGTLVATNATGGAVVLSPPNPVPYGTSVVVSAVPNPGNYLVNWTGNLSGLYSPIRYTVTTANPTFGALFTPLPTGKFTLATIINGNGIVGYSPQASYYSSNTTVALTASAGSGANFFGWSLGATGRTSPLPVLVTNNTVIQANFGVAPTVTVSPLNQTVFAGSNAVLTASEMGLPPLTNQWQNSQGAIPGATNSTLILSNIQPAGAGGYFVVVSSSVGSVTSAVATVTVISSPVITNQPSPATLTVGHSATFTVGAYGAPLLAYQWWLNGLSVPGATNAMLSIPNAFPANAGAYRVVVTNAYGSVTSTPAGLSVLPLYITLPAKKLANGQFQITFDTASGVNYEVDSSSDLVHWSPWLYVSGNGQPLTLSDPGVNGNAQRYYRISLSPQ